MIWREDGILLSARHHGENAAIIEVFTRSHGRHAGVVPGGASRRMAPVLQPGAQLDLTWRARLAAHVGRFTAELARARSGQILGDRRALAGLNAVTALLRFALPEREAHAALYDATLALLDLLGTDAGWPVAYLHWELALLEDLGFGLDLSVCAVTGQADDLIYVSPTSGRAVSRGAASRFAARMLALPEVMRDARGGDREGVAAGLATTGHFIARRLAPALGDRPPPAARQRLVDLLSR